MVALSDVTFLRLVLPAAGCELDSILFPILQLLTQSFRFAFVEYEDRRDADDAYHEMHNKRIGRDDILKIEVSLKDHLQIVALFTNRFIVGAYPPFGLLALRLWPRPRPT